MLIKEFLRELKKSRNRFISILLIVLLGTAFFAGIRASGPDMRQSADAYYDQVHFMDIRVIGTLGMTEEDIDAIKKVDGIQDIQGAYNTDVFCDTETEALILHMMSLTDSMDEISLLEGRLPTQPDECLVDERFADTSKGWGVGDTITVYAENHEDLSDTLANTTFTITGIGTSPYYLSLERGSSAIGNGEVSNYVMVPKSSFSMDVYSTLVATVTHAPSLQCYEDEYEDRIDAIKTQIETLEQQQCENRYNSLQEEGLEEIQEAEQEIADARKELADAKQELDEGEEALADGWQEVTDNQATLEETEEELRNQEQTLKDAADEIAANEARLKSAREEIQSGQQEIASGQAEINKNQAYLDSMSAELKAMETTLNETEATLNEQSQQLADIKEKLETYETGLSAWTAGAEALAQDWQQYETKKANYEAGLAQWEEVDAPKLQQLEEELQVVQEDLNHIEDVDSDEYKELKTHEEELQKRILELKTTKSDLDQSKLDLENRQSYLTAQQADLDMKKQALDEAKTKLDPVLANLDIPNMQAQIDAGYAQIASGREELNAAKAQLSSGYEQLSAAKAQLQAARNQLADGQRTYVQGQEQLRNAREEVRKGQTQIADAWAQINDGRQQIQEAIELLHEKQQDLEEGKQEYEEALVEAEESIAEGEESIRDGKQQLADMEMPTWYVLDRNSVETYVSYGQDAQRIVAIGNVFPVIFFLVAALICLTTMTRMVEENRTQIGTLKALGYSNGTIAMKYLTYAFLATCVGGVLGVILGQKLLPVVIIQAYGILYTNLPVILTPIQLPLSLLSIFVAMGSTMAATLAACLNETVSVPAALMRPEAPKSGKRILLERATFIWKRLSFTMKSTFRNLFRYKKRFFMTVLGIGGCMGLLLVGFGLKDSIRAIGIYQYGRICTYDGTIELDDDRTEADANELEQHLNDSDKIDEYLYEYMTSTDVTVNGQKRSTYFVVPEEPAILEKYISLKDRIGHQMHHMTDEGVIMSEKLAKLLSVSAGDTISIGADGEKQISVKIAAITENYFYHYVYMTPGLYESVYGEPPEYNNMMLKLTSNDDGTEDQMRKELMELSAVNGITYVTKISQRIDDMIKSMDTIIYVIVIAAGLLAFVVLYNLNNININERMRELATLKVLGFYEKEVSAYVLRENILLTMIGALTGFAFGIGMHYFVIITAEIDIMMFGREIFPMSYIYSVALTFLFSALVNVFMHFRLKKINMVESMKSVE